MWRTRIDWERDWLVFSVEAEYIIVDPRWFSCLFLAAIASSSLWRSLENDLAAAVRPGRLLLLLLLGPRLSCLDTRWREEDLAVFLLHWSAACLASGCPSVIRLPVYKKKYPGSFNEKIMETYCEITYRNHFLKNQRTHRNRVETWYPQYPEYT